MRPRLVRGGARSAVALVAISVAANVVLGAATSASANGAFETYGPSVRARAMGNAMSAIEDSAAAHTNPAAVGRAPGELLFHAAFSLDTPVVDVALEEAQEQDDPLTPALPNPVAGITLGFLIPLDLVFEDRIFVGGTAYFPTQVLVRARAHDPQRPFFYAYDSGTDHYDMSLAIGARVFDWLFLGGGVRLSAGQQGDVLLAVDPVRGRMTQQSVDTFQYPKASPTAGLLIGPLGVEDVVTGSLGVVYREPAVFDISLPASLTIEGADVNAVLDVLVRANFSPRTVTAGASFEILRDVIVDVEAQYAFWSEAPPPFVITGVDLGGEGLEALGLEDGLDAPAAGQDRVGPPGFVDTVNVRAGVEWHLLKDVLAARAGYQYRPSPVPDQTSGTNIIDCTTHVVGAGFGLTFVFPLALARPVTIDAAYQAQILQPRTATKPNPNDDVGAWTAQGIVHALALGWTYQF